MEQKIVGLEKANRSEERRLEALTSADMGKEVVFLSSGIDPGW